MTAEQRYEYYYEDVDSVDPNSESPIENKEKNSEEPNEERNIRYRRTEARSGSVMQIILISILAAIILGSVIYSLDRRNTMYNKVASLNKELNSVEAENVRLQSELDSEVSAKNVEDYAVNVLKMQQLDDSQMKYIKIQTGDVVTIPKQDEGFTAKINNFFDNCVEYFRG